MKYLVTGGAGFIGSNIVEELVRLGEFVRVIDNFATGKKENLAGVAEKIEFIEGMLSAAIISCGKPYQASMRYCINLLYLLFPDLFTILLRQTK